MPGKDIFLSYAREDLERAKALVGVLQARGWSVWWDRRIRTGKTFAQVIDEAIEQARCGVVLWTQDSVESHWVLNEANECLQRGILVPVLLEEVRVPIQFRHVQTASLIGWDGDPERRELQKLLKDIANQLGDESPGETTSFSIPRIEPRPPPPKERSRLGLKAIGGGAAAIALTVFATSYVVERFRSGPSTDTIETTQSPPPQAADVPPTEPIPETTTIAPPAAETTTAPRVTTTTTTATPEPIPEAAPTTTSIDPEILLERGVYYRSRSMRDQALASFQEAADAVPDEPRYQNALGAAFHDLNRYPEAVTAFRRAIELDPSYATAHAGLAATFHDMKELDQAANAYLTAAQLRPDIVRFHTGLGSVLHDAGRLDAAETAFLNALSVDASYASAHNGLGAVHFDKGSYADAAVSFREAINLNANDARAHYNLGLTLKRLGREAEGDREIELARQLGYAPSR